MNRFLRRDFLKGVGTGALVLGTGSAISAASAEPLRFAVASDGHFGQPGTNYERFHREMMGWLNEEALGKGLDFVIFNGDLIHDEPRFLPQVKEAYEDLEMPYFVTKGNHDRVDDATWEKTWGYPPNSSFERAGSAFLLVTTSNEAGEYLCADLDWLSRELERHRGLRHVFVFLHISQHRFTRHGIDCDSVTGLLEESPNVTAVFHGHDHDLDHVIYWKERAYLFDGHLGGSWGTHYRGYRIVEVPAAGEVLSYQCNPAAFRLNSVRLG